jgi:hypothetical protein
MGCNSAVSCAATAWAHSSRIRCSRVRWNVTKHRSSICTWLYLGPGDSSIPYTPYFKCVTSRDYSICCIGRNRDLRYSSCICIPNAISRSWVSVSRHFIYILPCVIWTLTTAPIPNPQAGRFPQPFGFFLWLIR